ncbi:MAG: hypothetical protein ACM3PU_09545, partial [Gemmatimonadota bacterium]
QVGNSCFEVATLIRELTQAPVDGRDLGLRRAQRIGHIRMRRFRRRQLLLQLCETALQIALLSLQLILAPGVRRPGLALP